MLTRHILVCSHFQSYRPNVEYFVHRFCVMHVQTAQNNIHWYDIHSFCLFGSLCTLTSINKIHQPTAHRKKKKMREKRKHSKKNRWHFDKTNIECAFALSRTTIRIVVRGQYLINIILSECWIIFHIQCTQINDKLNPLSHRRLCCPVSIVFDVWFFYRFFFIAFISSISFAKCVVLAVVSSDEFHFICCWNCCSRTFTAQTALWFLAGKRLDCHWKIFLRLASSNFHIFSFSHFLIFKQWHIQFRPYRFILAAFYHAIFFSRRPTTQLARFLRLSSLLAPTMCFSATNAVFHWEALQISAFDYRTCYNTEANVSYRRRKVKSSSISILSNSLIFYRYTDFE